MGRLDLIEQFNLRRIRLALVMTLLSFIPSTQAISLKLSGLYLIDIIFADFENDHVQLFVDGRLVIDRAMSVIKEPEPSGFAYSQKVSLHRCSHVEVKARHFDAARTLCVDERVKAIFVGGGPHEPRFQISHGELGFD